MQTVKCRARWLRGGDPQVHKMWEVKHPDTGATFWSDRAHDAAKIILERYVLPNQIEPVLK